MKLSLSKTRKLFPLSGKKPLKKTISAMFGWLALLIFTYIGYFGVINFLPEEFGQLSTFSLSFVAWSLIIFFLISILTYVYEYWYFLVYFYDLTHDFVMIKKGVITPSEITIPLERIQDVNVDQDIFDRIFGLYDVHLSSATITSGIEAHIDGVEKTASVGLRDELLNIIGRKISRKAEANTDHEK